MANQSDFQFSTGKQLMRGEGGFFFWLVEVTRFLEETELAFVRFRGHVDGLVERREIAEKLVRYSQNSRDVAPHVTASLCVGGSRLKQYVTPTSLYCCE